MSKIVRSIKNVANGYSRVQVLVRNATSNDDSGPTTSEMEEIRSYTHQTQTDFLEIMDMLDRRLNDKGKNWRHVAKSLTVLDYLVRYGSWKCVMWAKDNLYIIKTLREFIHLDEAGRDHGALIRVKAKELVALLQDDERLKHEREMADKRNTRERPSARNGNQRDRAEQRDAPYDEDLERALELSRITAEREQGRGAQDDEDPDLKAALKLSLEEEEMRKLKAQQNENLLDLDDPQPQYAVVTGYYQQQQPAQYFQQPQQQYDMFGNPIQNPMATGYYQQPQFTQQQQYLAQPQQPQFTGFNYQPQQQQQQQPQEALQPLKTGSNNPFALSQNTQSQPQSHPTLNNLAQQQAQQQTQFFTQPPQQQQQELRPQNTSSSKFGDHSHPELSNLLAQGTGVDTFGNTGDTRIPHQHTQTQTFINSSGTGYRVGDGGLNTNPTGNPFLSQPTNNQAPRQQPAYTGYGFGNAPASNQRNDGPSLIDI